MVAIPASIAAGCGGGEIAKLGKTEKYRGDVGELLAQIRQANASIKSCRLEYEIRVTEEETTRTRRGTAWLQGVGMRLEEHVWIVFMPPFAAVVGTWFIVRMGARPVRPVEHQAPGR